MRRVVVFRDAVVVLQLARREQLLPIVQFKRHHFAAERHESQAGHCAQQVRGRHCVEKWSQQPRVGTSAVDMPRAQNVETRITVRTANTSYDVYFVAEVTGSSGVFGTVKRVVNTSTHAKPPAVLVCTSCRSRRVQEAVECLWHARLKDDGEHDHGQRQYLRVKRIRVNLCWWIYSL